LEGVCRWGRIKLEDEGRPDRRSEWDWEMYLDQIGKRDQAGGRMGLKDVRNVDQSWSAELEDERRPGRSDK
jgi:hypothetical protein